MFVDQFLYAPIALLNNGVGAQAQAVGMIWRIAERPPLHFHIYAHPQNGILQPAILRHRTSRETWKRPVETIRRLDVVPDSRDRSSQHPLRPTSAGHGPP